MYPISTLERPTKVKIDQEPKEHYQLKKPGNQKETRIIKNQCSMNYKFKEDQKKKERKKNVCHEAPSSRNKTHMMHHNKWIYPKPTVNNYPRTKTNPMHNNTNQNHQKDKHKKTKHKP